MSRTINNNTTPERVTNVYEIIRDFFGEEFVDTPNKDGEHEYWYVLIWWPRVTVTNESNKSVVIKDLYAKVYVNSEGRIPYETRGFQLNRTTYPFIQWESGYIHSHVPAFYHYQEGPTSFETPCLGTGPIANTVMDLKNSYEEAVWMLFCQELSLYVTVESLRGGPYIKLESIGARDILSGYEDFHIVDTLPHWARRVFDLEILENLLKTFTLWYLQNGHLKFNYKQEEFECGLSHYDFMVDISNSFIEWYNLFGPRDYLELLYNRSVLVQAKVSQGKFYKVDSSSSSYRLDELEGREMFYFKGQMKTLHIEGTSQDDGSSTAILLNHELAMYILNRILRIINYRYCNEHNKLPESGSTQEGASSTYQTVLYL